MQRTQRCLATFVLVGAWILASSIAHADTLSSDELEARLELAGTNREQIEQAIASTPDDQLEGMHFLLRHMPTEDLQSLTADFLREHVDYAYRGWREAPWFKAVSQEVFLNNVLPYANINERRDQFRKDFYERFKPLIEDCETPGVAAARLNQKIFPLLDVRYSTKRPKADQSPYESIEAKLASCTGLSILLIDACRSVGVPARFVGTPLWTDRSGNHSWVEVYDNGWHFTGAAEATGDDLDKAWFVDRASRAKADEPRHAIYAVSFRTTPLRFPLIWDRRIDYVRAVNVTDRYAGRGDVVPEDHVQVMFRMLNPQTRDRCAVNFRIRDKAGNIVYQGKTKDERFDANDHLTVALPEGQQYAVEVLDTTSDNQEVVETTQIDVGNERQLITLSAATAPDPASSEANGQATDDENSTEDSSNESASSDAIKSCAESLRGADVPLVALEAAPFLATPLTEADATRAQMLIWDAQKAFLKLDRQEEFEQRVVKLGDHEMKFAYQVFGEAPKTGRRLFISMHGGGNAPPRLNDRQWENQKDLYQPAEGVYLAPRAPTNTWNLWHEAHIDPLFDRLITDMIVFENVDPNRVYLMGYSAGGDGVYQLAPRFADRLAAAAMMAGHPNETSPLGLRNLPFTLHMGGDDGAYNRNQVAAEWREKLKQLQAEDPQGYEHWVEIHAGKGHWMDRQDAAAVPWMSKFSRNAWPKKIVWKQDDVTHTRFYWLAVPPDEQRARSEVNATCEGQTIRIATDEVKQFDVRLSDQLVDLDRPVTVIVNGKTIFEGTVSRTLQSIVKSLKERNDPASIFTAEIHVDVSGDDPAVRTS